MWLATEVVAPDLFTRAVNALRSPDEIRKLSTDVQKDTGIRPGRAYRRWLNSDDTWTDLVRRTDEAYQRLIASLGAAESQRWFRHDLVATDVVALVDATVGHFVASLQPSNAIAVVGSRIDAHFDTVGLRLDEITERLDERTQLESRLSQLPPAVRLILGKEHLGYARKILDAVALAKDRRAATEGLVRVNPPWLQNAPPVIQLAVAELCESYNLDAEAAHFFVAAADGGLDRAYLYARGSMAAFAGGNTIRSQQLLDQARGLGGGPAVDMMAAALAADPPGILASMTAQEALADPLLTMYFRNCSPRQWGVAGGDLLPDGSDDCLAGLVRPSPRTRLGSRRTCAKHGNHEPFRRSRPSRRVGFASPGPAA